MNDQEWLREFLQNRDEPCPVCGYNLRNLESGCCPECGATLVLGVSAQEVRFGWFLVTVAPMLMLAAFGVFVGVAWLPMLLKQPPLGALLMAAAAITDICGVTTLYRYRHVFLRLSRGWQAVAGICSWIVHLAVFGYALILDV